MSEPFQDHTDVLAKLTGRKAFSDDFSPGSRGDVLSGGQTLETIFEDLGVSRQRIESWKTLPQKVELTSASEIFDGSTVSAKPGVDPLTGLRPEDMIVGERDGLTSPPPSYTLKRPGM